MTPEMLQKMNRQIQILYLEPSPDARLFKSAILKRNYGEVIATGSGKETILFMQNHRPDILITEFYPGDMSFSDLVDQMQTLEYRLPVIIITDWPDKAARWGFKGYIFRKTVQEQELVNIINRVLFQTGHYELAKARMHKRNQ